MAFHDVLFGDQIEIENVALLKPRLYFAYSPFFSRRAAAPGANAAYFILWRDCWRA
jgi:hypothetical protein